MTRWRLTVRTYRPVHTTAYGLTIRCGTREETGVTRGVATCSQTRLWLFHLSPQLVRKGPFVQLKQTRGDLFQVTN